MLHASHFCGVFLGIALLRIATQAGAQDLPPVVPAAPAYLESLVVTSARQTIEVGRCSGPVQVRTQSPLRRPGSGALAGLTTIYASATGAHVYSDDLCRRPAHKTLTRGGSATFYFSADAAGTATLTFRASNKRPASQEQTIVISGAAYPLGELPSEIAIRWPQAPRITRRVKVRSAAAFTAAAATAGTQIDVRGGFSEPITITASDVDVLVSDGARLGILRIDKGLRRIAVRGGTFRHIGIQRPSEWIGDGSVARPELLVEDVMLDDVTVENPEALAESEDGYAFNLRGKRIAVVRSTARAAAYSVWSDAEPFQSEDIILAGNDFRSDGAEATVRIVNALRTVVIENRLQNGSASSTVSKHNYRVHGESDLNFAARNTLVYSGVYCGTMPEDALGRLWFNDNTMHQLRPSLFEVSRTAVEFVEATGNHVYSDSPFHAVFFPDVPARWNIRDNETSAYREP